MAVRVGGTVSQRGKTDLLGRQWRSGVMAVAWLPVPRLPRMIAFSRSPALQARVLSFFSWDGVIPAVVARLKSFQVLTKLHTSSTIGFKSVGAVHRGATVTD